MIVQEVQEHNKSHMSNGALTGIIEHIIVTYVLKFYNLSGITARTSNIHTKQSTRKSIFHALPQNKNNV